MNASVPAIIDRSTSLVFTVGQLGAVDDPGVDLRVMDEDVRRRAIPLKSAGDRLASGLTCRFGTAENKSSSTSSSSGCGERSLRREARCNGGRRRWRGDTGAAAVNFLNERTIETLRCRGEAADLDIIGGRTHPICMRVIVFILSVLIAAPLLANIPSPGGAGGMAQDHAGASDAAGTVHHGKMPCPTGHCPDNGPGQSHCPPGLGTCGGVVLLAVLSALPEFGSASTRVPSARMARPRFAPLPHDPPPPRAPSINV